MRWKEKFKNFLFMKDIDGNFIISLRYLLGYCRLFPNFIPKKPKDSSSFSYKRRAIFNHLRENITKIEAREMFIDLLDKVVEQTLSEKSFSSLVWPTIVGPSYRKTNLWFKGEKEPTEDDIWHALYLWFTSIKVKNALINITELTEDGIKWIWERLRIPWREFEKISLDSLIGEKVNWYGNFFSALCVLGFIIRKMTEELEEKQKSITEEIFKEIMIFTQRKLGITSSSSIVILSRKIGGKKEPKPSLYIFPRLSEFCLKWFDKEFSLIRFLNSFTQGIPRDAKELELIGEEREKLIFYLLNYHAINGEILSRIVELKASYELREGRMKGFKYDFNFFSKL